MDHDAPNQGHDERQNDANILAQHLPSGYSAEPESVLIDRGRASEVGAEEESSLSLLGGDVHRDLYKIDAKAKAERLRRAVTYSSPAPTGGLDEAPGARLSAAEQRAPGGFRRQFLLQDRRLNTVAAPVTRSFVDFLDLYGHFAGEDLAASDDESHAEDDNEDDVQTNVDERRPLLKRQKTSRRAPKDGDAGATKSFFTLLKAFIGTGIMFLPKAFNNGGILFSSITLITVSIVSCVCFHLLLQCRKQYGGGYGEIGEAIGGLKIRSLILASITISQIGFVCAGLIFVAENLYSFFAAITQVEDALSVKSLIAVQLVLLIPLAFIRNISKLGPAAMLADVCIAIGLVYIYYYNISTLTDHGLSTSVKLFNPDHYTLTIGSSIFTFEGIGLILPIQSSMKQPERFSILLYIVMFLITIVFTSVGALSYATFGSATQTEIISNFPQTSKLVNAVQLIYSFAILVGTPVQLFPASRIIEGKIFGRRSGKESTRTKWKKNILRTSIVLLCGLISVLGASDLDKFVALIGSFACVPLVYIYPAFLHYKGVANNRTHAIVDISLMVLGFVGMIYTSFITIYRWIEE